MPKILYAASSYGHIRSFHIPYIQVLRKRGWTVDVLAGGDYSNLPEDWNYTPVTFQKSFFSIKNFITAFKIARLIKDNGYDVVYVHTSLAAFFLRLGVMLSGRKKPIVINMVHGYLFDENTSFLKRMILLCAEKFTKAVTDTIIVMNKTDYEIAEKYKLYRHKLYFVHGVGVDTTRFSPIDSSEKKALRKKYYFPENELILVYAAEFSKRKNQSFLISCMDNLVKENIPVRLILLGRGDLLAEVQNTALKLGLKDKVYFPGHVSCVEDYARLADICVSSSRSEGLPLNVMEGMACGLPVVLSSVKGHIDLVKDGENGYLYPFGDEEAFCQIIRELYSDKNKLEFMGNRSRIAIEPYDFDSAFSEIMEILEDELSGENSEKRLR